MLLKVLYRGEKGSGQANYVNHVYMLINDVNRIKQPFPDWKENRSDTMNRLSLGISYLRLLKNGG
jgi:hypothetical protein